MSEEIRNYRHILGNVETQRSAVLITDYMRQRFKSPTTSYPPEAFHYERRRSLTGESRGYDVLVNTGTQMELEQDHLLVEVARALMAALGEKDVWA